MNVNETIYSVGEILSERKIIIPRESGVYAFWWVGDKDILMKSNRDIVLKGPNEKRVKVRYEDWWPKCLKYPCLYVGKSTNLNKRFGLHIKNGSDRRLHTAHAGNYKAKPHTTSCQLRFGIEHIFPKEEKPLEIIKDFVGFSWTTDFTDNAIAERFFTEDLRIGTWRPWFNIDSER